MVPQLTIFTHYYSFNVWMIVTGHQEEYLARKNSSPATRKRSAPKDLQETWRKLCSIPSDENDGSSNSSAIYSMKIISSQSQIYTWFSVYPTFFTGVIPCSAGTIKTEPVRITEERLYMLHALPVTNQRHHGNASSHGISPYGLSRSTTITHLSASFLRTTSANRYQQVPACHKCQTILSLMKQEILKRLRGGSCITQTI